LQFAVVKTPVSSQVHNMKVVECIKSNGNLRNPYDDVPAK